MSEHSPDRARTFGPVAEAYDRGRPSYPRAAAAWLAGSRPATVLELGAGTGKLTAELVALGHDVHATEPDPQMLQILAEHLPDVRRSLSAAEEIPLPDGSVDVVVAAQAFHWFDETAAMAEIVRVLKPHGRLALAWNQRDHSIPWVRRLSALIGTPGPQPVHARALMNSPSFGPVQQETFRFWHQVDRDRVQALFLSGSAAAGLDEAARAARLAEVLDLYDSYGRGMDGMKLSWTTHCFRSPRVDYLTTQQPASSGRLPRFRSSQPAAPADLELHQGPSDGTDTELLLIDFH